MSTDTHIPEPVDTITNVLMRKSNHFPPLEEVDKQTAEIKQYNKFVDFLKESNYGVQGIHASDYISLVKHFCKLSWEIDPH